MSEVYELEESDMFTDPFNSGVGHITDKGDGISIPRAWFTRVLFILSLFFGICFIEEEM